MDLIQVDLELFITCRLCVEERGQYQIVPSLQEKIKYCFDIDVIPFDGLPQLICDKCNKVLSNVAQWKQSYTEKQKDLLIRTKKNDAQKNILQNNVPTLKLDQFSTSSTSLLQPQQDTVSSSQQVLENNELSGSKPNTKQKRLSNYSSNDDASERSYNSLKKVKKKSPTFAWKRDYKRKMVCNICNKLWTNKKLLTYHYKKCHLNLCQKYGSILDKYCFVKLNKVDGKLNLTGHNDTVVLDANRIVEGGNNKYYILYSKDTYGSVLPTQNEYSKTEQSSSDDEITVKPKVLNKKRRLMSRSSNETVVIGNSKVHSDSEDDTKFDHNVSPSRNMVDSQGDFINIDSSGSDQESDNKKSDTRPKQVNEASFNDYKVIQGIITRCLKAFEDKNELTDIDMNSKKTDTHSSTESQLQHKIISIGRKVITKQGFNCTGLLRYLEYKNLEIVWIRKQTVFGMKDANYIRILTKLRDSRETYYSNKWIKVMDVPPVENVPVEESAEQISNTDNGHDDSAVIYCNTPGTDSKILLNENPVANPKQLTKSKKMSVKNKEDIICMPIITSTTSLAKHPENLPTVNADSTPASAPVEELPPPPPPTQPRIKVKPVAELMSDKPLCRFEPTPSTHDANSSTSSNVLQAENVWPPQNGLNVYVAPQTHISLNIHSSRISTDEIGASIPRSSKETVMLDTVELPNTITDSPYIYIRDLLQLHNLLLKDPLENLSHDYFCLVKFKVLFNQDSTEPPVVLCLSLFNCNNMFCLKLRDHKQMAIDINKLSANWQWEILQIYRGDLVRCKALQNAQKISQETHNITYNFLCVLKSVKKL